MLTETIRRRHVTGHPVQTFTNRHYTFVLETASKDVLREACSRENVPGYSNMSADQLRERLRALHVARLIFQIQKKQ